MADDHVSKTIEMVQAQVRDLERQLLDKKRVVNDLCKLAGQSAIYADADSGTSVTTSIRPDEFYGQPLASVVRSILEKRRAAGLGAASVNEIYEAMQRGGYKFAAANDDNSKRGLYISLGKNSTTFHKLPNGTYGLLEWYPNAKVAKETNDDAGEKDKDKGKSIPEDQSAAAEAAEAAENDESEDEGNATVAAGKPAKAR